MIKKFVEYNRVFENLEGYDGVDYSQVDPGETDDDMMVSAVKQYHGEIDRGLEGTAKVVKVQGFADETDSDLEFTLSDGNTVDVVYKFHPWRSRMTVTVQDEHGKVVGERSYRIGEPDEEKYVHDAGETGVDRMVKEIYTEEGLIEPVMFEIALPKEIWGNGIYYDINPETDQHHVGFESEEDAQKWIDSLSVRKVDRDFRG